MYYVATPERPYPNDRLHHGDLEEMQDWAQAMARRTGQRLDVREAGSQALVASYSDKGEEV